jgi:voltage-gated sodium channel
MLFGTHPDPDMQAWFGTIGRSMYTLFQVMTLESWSMGIVRPTMAIFPNAWIFFVAFIIVTSFAVLNLFIAIIVNAMDAQNEDERQARDARLQEAAHADSTTVLNEVKALRAELVELRQTLAEKDDRP